MNAFLRNLSPTHQVAALFFIVFGVLTLVSIATLLVGLRERRNAAHGEAWLREFADFRALLRTTWFMAVVFWIGWALGPGVATLLFALIAFFALREGLQEVVKASLIGSILGNILLVMGLAMFVGGLNRKKQTFSAAGAQAQASMLLLAVVACVLWVLAWRRRASDDVSRRLHDLARVGLLGAGFAVALLAVAGVVGAAAAGEGLLRAVLAPSWLLVVAVAVVMTTLVLRALAPAARPPR